MNWFRQIFLQLRRQPFYWLMIVLTFIFMTGWGIVRSRQDSTFFSDMNQYVMEEQVYISNISNYIRMRQQFNPSYDQSQEYNQIQMEKLSILRDWQEDLRQESSDVADHVLTYNQLIVQESEIDYKMGPIDLQSAQDQMTKANYLVNHQYPYIDEALGWRNAFFPLTLSTILFNTATAFILLLVFGFTIYQDVADHKVDFFFTLPMRREAATWKYSFQLLQAALSMIVVFFISLIPLVGNNNLWTLNYPIVITQSSYSIVYPIWAVIGLRLLYWLIGLMLLHLITLCLLRVCQSEEANMIVTGIILLVTVILTQLSDFHIINPGILFQSFDDLIYRPYPILPLCIYGILVIVGLLILHHSGYVSKANQWLNDKYNHRTKTQLNHKRLPTWFQFEWQKRFGYASSYRLLLLFGSIWFLSYVVSVHQTHQAQANFVNRLTQEKRQAEKDLISANIMHLEMLSQTFYSEQAAYEQRDDLSQSYVAWYAEKYPGEYQAISRNLISQETYYHLLQNQLTLDDYTGQNLIDYRNAYYDYYTINVNPFLQGVVDPTILAEKYLLAGQKENEWIINQHLQPLLSADGLADFVATNQSPLVFQRVDDRFLYSLYYWIQRFLPILLFICLILGFSATLSDEWDGTSGINWLLTQPFESKALYRHKLTYNFLIFIIIFMIGLSLHAGISVLISGWGQADYPVLVYDSQSVGTQPDYAGYYASVDKVYFHFISLGSYLIQAMMLFTSGAVFVLSVITCVSTFFKNRLAAIGTSFAILIGGYYVQSQIIQSTDVSKMPFLFLNIRETLDGWWNHLSNTSIYHPTAGAIILLTWAIMINLAGYGIWQLRLKKRGV